jgi:hypothetical protein
VFVPGGYAALVFNPSPKEQPPAVGRFGCSAAAAATPAASGPSSSLNCDLFCRCCAFRSTGCRANAYPLPTWPSDFRWRSRQSKSPIRQPLVRIRRYFCTNELARRPAEPLYWVACFFIDNVDEGVWVGHRPSSPGRREVIVLALHRGRRSSRSKS